MESLTKNKQDKSTIKQMVEKYFSPLELKTYKELTEGYFNVAYEITLSDEQKVILKIAPSKEIRIMTYEKNIMFSEVEAMKTAARYEEIPVPEVIGYDDSCTICETPYFFMEKLEGKSLNAVKSSLTPDQIETIYTETGEINRKINEICCSCFGYPGQPEFQGEEWYPVFRKMLEAGVNDAKHGNVDLKIPIDNMWACLEEDKEIFKEVTEPKLVHWDCWDGNIFVLNGRVTGLIDWERSLWADPLMEVGFRTYSDNTFFQKGYGIGALTEKQRRRALWYDIYLMVLVASECEYRNYETMDMYHWSTQVLMKQFAKAAARKDNMQNNKYELIQNLDKLHTTDLGIVRIKKNLSLDVEDVVVWCSDEIQKPNAVITRRGKNWYIDIDECEITVNAYSYTIITAHKTKGEPK
ncbi:DUF3781 domain-containing protein [Konateibacter massiliensis]